MGRRRLPASVQADRSRTSPVAADKGRSPVHLTGRVSDADAGLLHSPEILHPGSGLLRSRINVVQNADFLGMINTFQKHKPSLKGRPDTRACHHTILLQNTCRARPVPYTEAESSGRQADHEAALLNSCRHNDEA